MFMDNPKQSKNVSYISCMNKGSGHHRYTWSEHHTWANIFMKSMIHSIFNTKIWWVKMGFVQCAVYEKKEVGMPLKRNASCPESLYWECDTS